MVNGFCRQKDFYGCGSYSFAHAMLLLGYTMTIDESKKYCKTVSYWDSVKNNLARIDFVHPSAAKWIKAVKKTIEDPGTSEKWIISAIRKFHCTPTEYESRNELKTKSWIEKNIQRGLPIICHFNWDQSEKDYGHWAVIGGKNKNNFIVIDSAPINEEIIDFYAWKKLKKRFIWFNEDDDKYFQFYGIAVKPVDSNLLKHSMVNRFHLISNQLRINEEFRKYWGYYTDDIMEIFGLTNGTDAAHVLESYQKQIIESAVYWSGAENKGNLDYLFHIYLFICSAYNIQIAKKNIEKVLIDFTAAFTKEADFY